MMTGTMLLIMMVTSICLVDSTVIVVGVVVVMVVVAMIDSHEGVLVVVVVVVCKNIHFFLFQKVSIIYDSRWNKATVSMIRSRCAAAVALTIW